MRQRFFGLVLFFSALCAVLPAFADEEIRRFDVEIEVEQDGDIIVTETLVVNVEGRQIRRGIFRELPAYYLDDDGVARLPYRYDILSIRKDGRREPYERERSGNAQIIRIGNPDRRLDYREHVYEIRYSVKNQIRYFETYDELYWNVTGSYWQFPILSASASVKLPGGARVERTNVFTGAFGETGRAANYRVSNGRHRFETTESLGARAGMTISLQLEKGVIDPPSASDLRWKWWARNGSLTVLGLSFFGLLGFYWRSFNRVGRDPVKGPVFPQYEPPEGYSPAAAHHIYHRGFSGHDGLIASVMYLAANGLMRIDVDPKKKKKTTLQKLDAVPAETLSPETAQLYQRLFEDSDQVKLGEKYDADFTSAYKAFRERVSKRYGAPYFKWNLWYVIIGAILSLVTLIFAIVQHAFWSNWHTIGVLALIGLNGLFMYLMPAPSRKGQDVRTHLEGFKLYMEKAEKLQLNAVEVGSEAPPPMTVERYETFLPYAVALGVEKPWTKHFEKLIPEEAEAYNPSWTNMHAHSFSSIGKMTDNMVSGMSSGVTSAMPQSSSSSGGSGGFSGGGGGGGGGGGW